MSSRDFTLRKITDDYTPGLARQKLASFFEDRETALLAVGKLNRTQVCVLAALLDGKCITTSGYSIPADYGVKRASAVMHSLEKEHFFPISSRRIETESDVGTKTKQALFFISQDDRERLKLEPNQILEEIYQKACLTKASQAQKEIIRLVKEFGEAGILELVKKAANDEPGPDLSAG